MSSRMINCIQRHTMLFRPACILAVIMTAVPGLAQHERGEIHLQVQDQRGGPLQASVELVSEINQVQRAASTDREGHYVARDLPFGVYKLRVSRKEFLPSEQLIKFRSEVPLTVSVTLGLAPLQNRINVMDSATLVDPQRTGTVYSVGPRAIKEYQPAQMGRNVTDLVDSQPGWVYEANGVLHPRGSEYDVQYLLDGVPVMENRSAAYAAPFEAEAVESMRVMTAGFPAEYGRKLGGVVDVSSSKDIAPGLHGTAAADAGSFSTTMGDVAIEYGRGSNRLTVLGSAGLTDRYLDSPVLANYTNHGSTGGFTTAYSRDFTDRDHLRLSVSHDQVHYLVPNELVQQETGQRQNGAEVETSAQLDYERVLSPNLLLNAGGRVRDQSFRLWSNALATPVVLSQQRGFREGYARVTLAGQHGGHDWKIGADAILAPAHEALQYLITNPSLFDPGTAASFSFRGRRTDVESSAFFQDELHWKSWNANLGIRYDDYRFALHQSAWSPRVTVSRFFTAAGVLAHASYDRIFQTPALENLLLASSPALDQVSSLVLRLPVQPAHANYYEVGITKGFWSRLRLDANVFRRDFRSYPDDDTLLNTGVSFPIADASARIQGIEGRLELPHWGRFSGFVSYANQVAAAQGPITGGLLIGAEAVAAVPDSSRFWVSQDQRNTAQGRLRFQATRRFWLAAGASFGSGLPVELDRGDTGYDFLLAQYGPRILDQVDLARGRVRPSYSLDAAAGLNLYTKEKKTITLQLQGSNLTNHLNVINFTSLFSGTALAPPRSFGVRLKMGF